jgi:hypothetical protein
VDVTCKPRAVSSFKAEFSGAETLLSKIMLAVLLFKLLGKLGWRTKLRDLKPRLDRAVNITLVVLALAYVGQLLWLYFQRRGSH